MPPNTPMSLLSLPEELILQILEFFPKHILLELRYVNDVFNRIAAQVAFRVIRFRAYKDEPERFMNIAETAHLRDHVREITCDTWNGLDYAVSYLFYRSFFKALPYIGVFRNLEALHLRFCEREHHYPISISSFRKTSLRVLDTVFHSLAGTWTEQRQRDLDSGPNTMRAIEHRMLKSPQNPPATPISLKTLTVSNLENYLEESLTTSAAFQTILNSKSLVDMRLYIATSMSDPYCGESLLFPRIQSSWLTPDIAKNLQVLSLYCHHPWGWLPKMDFRLIGVDGLPNLKTLALGNFEFTHWWQVEWFGSLGIEKFYLDGCTVLFSEFNWTGMKRDRSETTVEDFEGKTHSFSNEGYYVPEEMPQTMLQDSELVKKDLRWHNLLSHWAKSMTNLRVLKIGQGYWDQIQDPWKAIDPTWYGYAPKQYDDDWNQRFTHHGFQHFECPTPLTVGSGIRQFGSWATQDYDQVFRYTKWAEPDENYPPQTTPPTRDYEIKGISEEVRSEDIRAFRTLIAAVEAKRRVIV
ncbi:hypothetical protein NW762_013266 [Fusarium torreyae]|uniref:F-box domain-containing protein n=1 Tax=Fusarium torreyae TaxID=1237075 RepID=A0A9W8RNS3_9HYPO|nr:hypothetical protein NW762_013266 [Fusarium torreyae]